MAYLGPWSFADIPEQHQNALRTTLAMKNPEKYRASRDSFRGVTSGIGVFEVIDPNEISRPRPDYEEHLVRWCSDGDDHSFYDPITDFSSLRLRVQKSKEEQKKRSKTAAEVFTPPWVVNLQNNIADRAWDSKILFNEETDDRRWIPTLEPIRFTERDDESVPGWIRYLVSPRLEMCCGEAPYLFTRYDAVTGDEIPVKDSEGRYLRVGLLDRKLRVVNENVDSTDEWKESALAAVDSIYGFDWAGDNVILSRMNLLNTVFDYLRVFLEEKGTSIDEPFAVNLLSELTTKAGRQIFQMDGLKYVLPSSCSENCESCRKKIPTGHDGDASVLFWAGEPILFEDLVSKKTTKSPKPQKSTSKRSKNKIQESLSQGLFGLDSR